MGKGPLAVRFGAWTLDDPQAGAIGGARVELENAGSVAWREGIRLAYHWLDERGNPIVWDGERTSLPELAPGERATVEARVRAPIPPGRYRFSLDLVADHRAWFSELGSETASLEVDVHPRSGTPRAEWPSWVEPTPESHERIAAAHAEGYAVVGGAIDWDGGFLHRRPRSLAPYLPGPGRIPNFAHPLLCPSVLDGIALERLERRRTFRVRSSGQRGVALRRPDRPRNRRKPPVGGEVFVAGAPDVLLPMLSHLSSEGGGHSAQDHRPS